jgi:hypothetical protein
VATPFLCRSACFVRRITDLKYEGEMKMKVTPPSRGGRRLLELLRAAVRLLSGPARGA